MNKNEKGFSIVEVLIVIVAIGLIGTVGWFTYNRQKSKVDNNKLTNTQTNQQEEKEGQKEEVGQTYPYTFKELGVSMEVLNGWEVKTNHTKQEGVNFYNWTVEKAGADGKISLSSNGFRGGFYDCKEAGAALTAATIKEVASTQNSDLMFMSWSYNYNNESNNRTSIVPTSETVFRTMNSSSAAAVKNQEVKAGNYFFCLSEPQAGFSLNLNNEDATGYSRKDSISALASSSSEVTYVTLPANAQSYSDIKAMLTSIR